MFTDLKALTIPEGEVTKITSGGVVLWEKQTSLIPNEYQQVKYIEVSGSQYINTNWTPSNHTIFAIKVMTNISGSYMFGTGNSPRLAMICGTGEVQIYNTSNSTSGIYPIPFASEGIYEIETYSTSSDKSTYTKVNGTQYPSREGTPAYAGTKFDTSLPMFLGAWNYAASTIRYGKGRIYYAKAEVEGVTIFDMLPCYRKSDGVIGMYDVVSKKFFTNAGTGSFTKGADV